MLADYATPRQDYLKYAVPLSQLGTRPTFDNLATPRPMFQASTCVGIVNMSTGEIENLKISFSQLENVVCARHPKKN